MPADTENCLTHDPSNPILANTLANLDGQNGPIPLGVIQKIAAPIYEEDLYAQIDEQVAKNGKGQFKDLLHSGNTWEVK